MRCNVITVGGYSSGCYFFLLILFASVLLHFSDGLLQFRDWGEKCKDSKNGQELVRPEDECDFSRGLICQKYSQGFYCGCHIGSSLSFDTQSRECRRKVASACSYETNEEILNRLRFNQKCHERAECVKLNSTAVSGSKTPVPTHVCLCKDGYSPTDSFDECVPSSSGQSASNSSITSFFLVFFLFVGIFVTSQMSC